MVALLTHFYQRNLFVYSINVLNFKGVSLVNTSLSVKYNKTLKAPPLGLYESIQLLVRVLLQIQYSASPVLFLPLDSHLKLYISYKLEAILLVIHIVYLMISCFTHCCSCIIWLSTLTVQQFCSYLCYIN